MKNRWGFLFPWSTSQISCKSIHNLLKQTSQGVICMIAVLNIDRMLKDKKEKISPNLILTPKILWDSQCVRGEKWDAGDLRGRLGEPRCGSSTDSHPGALARENTTNLIRVGQVKYMHTPTSHMHMHTQTHTQLTHSFGKGAQAARSIGKMAYSKAWKRWRVEREVINGSFGNIWVHNQHLPPSN